MELNLYSTNSAGLSTGLALCSTRLGVSLGQRSSHTSQLPAQIAAVRAAVSGLAYEPTSCSDHRCPNCCSCSLPGLAYGPASCLDHRSSSCYSGYSTLPDSHTSLLSAQITASRAVTRGTLPDLRTNPLPELLPGCSFELAYGSALWSDHRCSSCCSGYSSRLAQESAACSDHCCSNCCPVGLQW